MTIFVRSGNIKDIEVILEINQLTWEFSYKECIDGNIL